MIFRSLFDGDFRRARRALKRLLNSIGAKRQTLLEFSATKQLGLLNLEEISNEDIEDFLSDISEKRRSSLKLDRLEFVVFVAITFFYFELSPDFQFSLIKVNFSDTVVSTLLFVFAVLNLVSFMSSAEVALKKEVLLKMLVRREDLDPSGYKRMKVKGVDLFSQAYVEAIKKDKIKPGLHFLITSLFQVSAAAILLVALLFVWWIVLHTSWDIASRKDWSFVYVLLFVGSCIGLISKFVWSLLLEKQKIRIIETEIEQEFWRNVKQHGMNLALEILEERAREKSERN